MSWYIEVKDKEGIFDAVGEGVKKDILDLGIEGIRDVRFSQAYILKGALTEADAKKIALQLLTDPIAQDFSVKKLSEALLERKSLTESIHKGEFVVEVAYNPGVMDPAEASIRKGIEDLYIKGIDAVRSTKKYRIFANLSEAQLKNIAEKLLYNKLIQHVAGLSEGEEKVALENTLAAYEFKLRTVELIDASVKKLEEISRLGQLFLNLEEMQQIQKYFKKLKRNPTDCELETIAQTWSEHCGHKTFRGKIKYTEQVTGNGSRVTTKKTKLIHSLLKSTIMKATQELKKPWCVSVFKDNSGVIRFDKDYNICFKVETHNHPSALEPFGGANTGIGGVIRDPMGTGLGAKPFLNTDVFCFAPPETLFKDLPAGTLHPKRIMKGVVAGVKDYGNKMGIPTVNGAVLFHERFVGNPLVYCGTAGILPRNMSFKQVKKGDLVLLVGGRTGRDGIHGATFSSGELTHESEAISSGAVQIGNPIEEKKTLDTLLIARDRGLYRSITDCGGGGLSSAVGEMGADLGVDVDLENIPLKYLGLTYTEIWISESQERMILSVPKDNLEALMEIFRSENVEAAVIGKFSGSKHLKLYYQRKLVCDLDMEFLHNGLPDYHKIATFTIPKFKENKAAVSKDLGKTLKQLLSHPDICSKEWIIRQYDHEVQGGSVIKPLTGVANDGPSDAAVVRPFLDSKRGVIVSCGINFHYGFLDPYLMAGSCIDEALRQVVSVGGSVERVAILDNFCWGNPDKPDRLGSLVRAAYGCYDAAVGFGVPFISGKDSLYNEFTVKGKSISIPGTLLISAISVMNDISKAITMYAKEPGNLIYVVGDTFDELGGSHYYAVTGRSGGYPPLVNPKKALQIFSALAKASQKSLIQSMHDCSEGGIALAAAEMAFAGALGMELSAGEIPFVGKSRFVNQKPRRTNEVLLFSQSNSRFVAEVRRKDRIKFENLLQGVSFGLIGCVTKDKNFRIFGLEGKPCIEEHVAALKDA